MTQTIQSFMTQSVLSQHLNAVWQQHYHQVVAKPVPPYVLEAVALISRNLASLANSDEPNPEAWKNISDVSHLVFSSFNKESESPLKQTVDSTLPSQGDIFDAITDPTT